VLTGVDGKEAIVRDGDLTAGIEAAWRGFRGRLADHLSAMDDDDILCVELQTGDDDERDGAAPYVQFCAYDDGMLHVEAVSNWYLDDAFQLSAEGEDRLVELGWERPREDEEGHAEQGWANFSFDAERRDADRVAALTVATLREVHGAVHPAFLDAAGLEIDPHAPRPEPSEAAPDKPDLPAVVFPKHPDELQELVDATVADLIEEAEVRHDQDGDIPVVVGHSVLFVRVLKDRAAVQIFADLVVDVRDHERVPVELGMLNSNHPFATFFAQDTRISVKHLICAAPFAPRHLKLTLNAMLDTLDDVARETAIRLQGRRFLDEDPDEATAPEAEEEHAALAGLMEVLHARSMSPSAVASLFDHDKFAVLDALAGLRSGRIDCPDHDLELVLDPLRRALSLIVARETRTEQADARRSRRSRSQQLSLLPPSDTLDDGEWEHNVS
jgi:type III secretion system-like peptide-binding chaperone